MTVRKKGTPRKPSREILEQMEKKRVQHQEDSAGVTGAMLGEGPKGAEYWRGRDDAFKDMRQAERDTEQDNAAKAFIANASISLEFGDSTIMIRDGRDCMIRRIPLSNDWSREVAEIMTARGTKNVGTRLSEHARFTIRERMQDAAVRQAVKDQSIGVGPGMEFDSTSPRTRNIG